MASGYSPSSAGVPLRLVPLIASRVPFRYPIPYPAIHAADAEPKTKSQVKPVGIAHTMCIPRPSSEIGRKGYAARVLEKPAARKLSPGQQRLPVKPVPVEVMQGF